MAAYAATTAYINSKLNNITNNIKEFIIEHQTYIPGDVLEGIGVVWGVKGLTVVGGSIIGAVVTLGFTIIGEGELILSVRDHYLPEEQWKYIAYHPPIFYEVRAYLGEDHCIHYVEIPKNPDGSLRWEDARYI